jgi:hypothetical protein
MGLPHDFKLVEPLNTKTKYTITQNVTTHTSRWITNEAVQWLIGNRASSGYKFIKHDNVKKKMYSSHPLYISSIEEL